MKKSHHPLIILQAAAAALFCLSFRAEAAAGNPQHPPEKSTEIRHVVIEPATPDVPRSDTASIAELSAGRLMVVYHKYEKGKHSGHDQGICRIWSKESDDGGVSWGRPRMLVDMAEGDMNVQAPALLRLKSGRLLLLCLRAHKGGDSSTMCLFSSDDEGKVFTPMKPVWKRTRGQLLQGGASSLIQLKSGRLVLPFHGGSGNQWRQKNSAWCFISDDRGETWRRSNAIELPLRGAMEGSVAELADGSLLMSLRTQLDGPYLSRSADGGATWRRAVPSGLKGGESGTCLRRIPGTGTVVLFWNNSTYQKGHHHFGERTPLTAAVSRDNGATWRIIGDIADDPKAEYTNLDCFFPSKGPAILTYMFAKPAWNRTEIHLRAALIPMKWFEEHMLGKWIFQPAHAQGQKIEDQTGRLPASVVGPAIFSKEPPEALLLDGNVKAKHRVLLAPDRDKTRPSLPIKAFTVEAWVKIEAAGEWGGIVSAIQDNGDFEKGWLLGIKSWGFCFALSTKGADDGNGKLTYLQSRVAYEKGMWYYICATYDGTTQKLYVDGQLQGRSTAQSGDINYPEKLFYTIGAYHDDNEFYSFRGEVAEVSIYDVALTDGQIQHRFSARQSSYPGIVPVKPDIAGWPTYHRDSKRSGFTDEALKLPLSLKWMFKTRKRPEPAWPPPAKQNYWAGKFNLRPRVVYDRAQALVVDGSGVYFGSSADDRVFCLDVETGLERWSFFTGGPVRLAPTIHGNRLYFGSDDGHVYCLNKKNGALLWKHRMGPADRWIPGNGRIVSVWPVRTGILISEEKVFCCAGLFPLQGAYRAALDWKTGDVLEKEKLQISAQGYLTRRGGKLYVKEGRAPEKFVSKLKRYGKTHCPAVVDIPKEFPYELIGAAELRFAGGDGKVAAFDAGNGQLLWKAAVQGKAYSLAVSEKSLFVSTDDGTIHCFSHAQKTAEARKSMAPDVKAFPYASEASRKAHEKTADFILKRSGISRGYCVVLGCGEGQLVHELARRGQFRMVGLASSAAQTEAARRNIEAAGLYGPAVIQEWADWKKLPFTDFMANLVIVDGPDDGPLHAAVTREVQRILRPAGGIALVRCGGQWDLHRRPALKGIGEWTHMYADVGNTVCSRDERVGRKLSLQWYGQPGPRNMVDRHLRTVSPLSKNGRLFIPGNDCLFAVDACNGFPLWEVDLPKSRRLGAFRDSSYLALSDDHLYAAFENHCIGLDVETGGKALAFEVPARLVDRQEDGHEREWGYLAVLGESLFGSVVKAGSSRRLLSKKTIDDTYYDQRPLVCSESIFSMNALTGQAGWIYTAQTGLILNTTLTIGHDLMFFVESGNRETLALASGRAALHDLLGKGSNITALNLKTGDVVWKNPLDLSVARHHLYACCSEGKLVITGAYNLNKRVHVDIWALSAETGKMAWKTTQNNGTPEGGSHGEQDLHPVMVPGKLIAEPFAYDLHTGKPLENWQWNKAHRRGCGTISASASALFFRQNNPVMFDLSSNRYDPITKVSRPGCWINMIPAGGLLLIPEASAGCTCDFPIQTSMGFLALPQD